MKDPRHFFNTKLSEFKILQRAKKLPENLSSLNGKTIGVVSFLAVLISLPSVYYFTKADTDKKVVIQEEPAIGGVGAVETGDNLDQKSEALKDALLADEPEEESTSESSLKKFTYTVKSGDTLSEIAKRYQVSAESIAGSSKITIMDEIHVGQKLSIPSKDGFFYNVKQGETLAAILIKYNVELAKFIAENPEINPDLLLANHEIFLPGAKPKNLENSWLVPVASRIITSPYGWRTWPRRAFHKGLDLKAPYVSVRASKSGVVTYSGWLGGYGNVIIIRHDGGYKTLYGHLSRRYVRKGAVVRRGAVIGRSGNTGYSFGPHLHFEISKNGKSLNPARYLKGVYRRR